MNRAGHGIGAPPASAWRLGPAADIRQDLPAPLAFLAIRPAEDNRDARHVRQGEGPVRRLGRGDLRIRSDQDIRQVQPIEGRLDRGIRVDHRRGFQIGADFLFIPLLLQRRQYGTAHAAHLGPARGLGFRQRPIGGHIRHLAQMHRILRRGSCPGQPGFLRREAEDRGQPRRQAFEQDVEHRQGRQTARAVRRIAIQRILADIEIEGRQIDRAELMQLAKDQGEIVGFDPLADDLVQLRDAVQDPALQFRHVLRLDPFGRIVMGQRPQQPAQRVAEAAVVIRQLLQHAFADAQIAGIVFRDDPEPQDLSAVFLVHFRRNDDIAQRFRHLAAVLGHDETVGQNGVIGRTAARAATFQQRGMEPAAMLVRSFQIQRCRPLQIFALLQAEGMGRPAVEPHIDDIADLLVIVGLVIIAQEARRIAGEPGIRPFLPEGRDDTVDDRLIAQRLAAFLVHEDRDRHAPGALTADAPVRALLDHRMQTRLALFRIEGRVFERLQGDVTQAVAFHRDEPLRRVAEDQRRLRPPAMRILVAQRALGQQLSGDSQFAQDRRVGVAFLAVLGNDDLARHDGHEIIEAAILTDGLGDFDPVLAAQMPVIRAMARCDMDEARTGFVRDVIGMIDGDVEIVMAVRLGMAAPGMGADRALDRSAFQLCDDLVAGDLRLLAGRVDQRLGDRQFLTNCRALGALAQFRHFQHDIVELFMTGDGPVAGDRPGRRRPDHDRRAVQLRTGSGDDRELHPDRRRFVFHILGFGFGQGGLFDRGPPDRACALVQAALHQEFADLGSDLRLGAIGHGQIGIVPIAQHTQPLELLALDVDPFVSEVAAFLAEFGDRDGVLVLTFGAVFLFNLPFDRQAVTIPARHIAGIIAGHLARPVDDVLQDLVQRVADMQMAVRIGGAVMQDELLAALGIRAQTGPQVGLRPALQDFRLALRQARAHREIGLGQVDRVFVIDGLRRIGAHRSASSHMKIENPDRGGAQHGPTGRTDTGLIPTPARPGPQGSGR